MSLVLFILKNKFEICRYAKSVVNMHESHSISMCTQTYILLYLFTQLIGNEIRLDETYI